MEQTVLDSIQQQPDTVAKATPVAETPMAAPVPHVHTATTIPQPHFDTAIPATLLRPHDTVFHPVVDSDDYVLMCYDSTFAPYKDLEVQQRESLFAGNPHSKGYPRPSLRQSDGNADWIFITIVILITLVSVYINSQKFKLKDVFQSLFDIRVLERVSRESNIRAISLLPMVGIYFASIAMVTLKTVQAYGFTVLPVSSLIFFLLTFAVLVAYILLKNGLIRLLGNIFEDRPAVALYISSNNLFYFIGGLISTPMLLVLFYLTPEQETVLRIAFAIIAIILIIRLFRGMQLILTNSKVSKLYLFYYLCIFEIAPILVMAKIILF